MPKVIAYTLTPYGNIGCLPECVLVDTDEHGIFSSHHIRIHKENYLYQEEFYSGNDKILIDCCLKLDKEIIAAKVTDRHGSTWDKVQSKYFNSKSKDPQILYIRSYLTDYIQSHLNRFFDALGDHPLYLPIGKFPFTWRKLYIETDAPELMYHFTNHPEWIYYSLDITLNNKALKLKNGVLVSHKIARVLLNDTIYEFDEDIDGLRLVPFFSKQQVSVSQANAEDYIEKVIAPLVPTQKVVSDGFDINIISGMTNAVLRIKEDRPTAQLSLFDDAEKINTNSNIILELLFDYESFRFWAGRNGKLTQWEMQLDGSFRIDCVERDTDNEKQIISSLRRIGLDVDGKIAKMPYLEGMEWINNHLKEIESAGIEIRFENFNTSRKLFAGNREISVILEESRDWFDVKGKVLFGSYEIPFVIILNHIKRNKPEIRLPNGEYAIIPQAWFEEYRTLSELSTINDGEARMARHYLVATERFIPGGKLRPETRKGMEQLLRSDFNTDFDLPVSFRGSLRHYQQEGYNWLRLLNSLHLGGCLADDMGLGKTVQTLCLLQWAKEQQQGISLLVVPTTLIYNWQKEASVFCPDLILYTHAGTLRTKSLDDFEGADLILTSYAVLRRDIALLEQLKYNYVVLDEAQMIKNPASNTAAASLRLQSRFRLTLTGTPIENSLTDLWMQMHFINRHMLGNLSHFLKMSKKSGKLNMYRKLIQPFMLRRHKQEVLKDLPEKSVIIQYCEMSDVQQEFYRNLRNQFRDQWLEQKTNSNPPNAIVLLEGLLRLRQAANHPVLADKNYTQSSGKFEMICEMLQDIHKQGNKALIFSSFTEHLRLYRQHLDESEIRYCYIDGSTKNRELEVARFQEEDDYPFFLLSLKAGGTGLNLTRAGYVLLLDPWWNPAAEAQAFDRAHRIGQKNKVFVYKFISSNTIEEKILKLQEEKRALFSTMLEEQEDTNALNIQDIMHLLEL